MTGYAFGHLGELINAGGQDVFLARDGPDGEQLWLEQVGSGGFDSGCSVTVSPGGDVYGTGDARGVLGTSLQAPGADLFILRNCGPD